MINNHMKYNEKDYNTGVKICHRLSYRKCHASVETELSRPRADGLKAIASEKLC